MCTHPKTIGCWPIDGTQDTKRNPFFKTLYCHLLENCDNNYAFYHHEYEWHPLELFITQPIQPFLGMLPNKVCETLQAFKKYLMNEKTMDDHPLSINYIISTLLRFFSNHRLAYNDFLKMSMGDIFKPQADLSIYILYQNYK